MSPGRKKLDMDGSWIVEDDNDSLEDSRSFDESPRKRTPRRHRQNNTLSPEPEFRMPRVEVDESLEASWMDESGRSPTYQRSPPRQTPYKEPAGDARRRFTKPGGNRVSPEKRINTNRSPGNYSPQASSSVPSSSDSNLQTILETTLSYASMILKWCLDVFGGSLKVLKTPITYILAVWMLFGAGVMVRNLVTNSVYASLSPICRVPGASLLNLPFCPVYQVDKTHGPPPPVEFDQLMAVQSKFEEVLEESAGGVSLPMDMKRGEASIRDLRQLVKYSQLHAR